jgi:hypothetical protein
MVTKPGDRPKIIALCAAVGILILYICVGVVPKLMHGSQGPAPSTPAVTPISDPTPTTNQAATLAARSPGPGGAAPIYAEAETPLPTTADPFQPPVNISKVIGHAIARPDLTRATGVESGSKGTTPPLLPAEVSVVPPVVELQGVLSGDPAVAVVRVGDQVFYRHKGDSLGYGLVLIKIAEASIVIRQGAKLINIEIGHTTEMKSTEAKPPEETAYMGFLPAAPPLEAAASTASPTATQVYGPGPPTVKAVVASSPPAMAPAVTARPLAHGKHRGRHPLRRRFYAHRSRHPRILRHHSRHLRTVRHHHTVRHHRTVRHPLRHRHARR